MDESDFVGGKLAVKDIKRFINSAQFKKQKTRPDADISGYRLDPALSTDESVVYYSPELNHAVHSIRATNGTLKDWANNGVYLASPYAYRQLPRYRNAVKTQTQMEQKYPTSKKSIVTHSQSGIMGRYLAKDRPETEIIQLNPASSWKDNTVNDNDKNVYTIKSTKDIVSSFHKNKPQDIIIPGESFNQEKEHDIGLLDRLDPEQMVGFGFTTYRDRFNIIHNFPKGTSHSLKEIADLTGYKLAGLKVIQAKGEGAYYSNPRSVRPTVNSAEQWGRARVYASIVPDSKSARIDATHLVKTK